MGFLIILVIIEKMEELIFFTNIKTDFVSFGVLVYSLNI
ncbi:hypothetical protein TSIB_1385 [Thermococcus sibiricus MM 739]|uniref:Uncharacterized protein n=1 Tax=Thermococcus sibiricus (strain DSM 12597 / MM 739) TaxID=604354 RepID=C6A491_THESM|nr:hypothetical protein TSIB_1385 [Thermococcus sibiricus MM 739]